MREIKKRSEKRREGGGGKWRKKEREGNCWATSSEHLDPAIPESCAFMDFPVA